MNINRIFRFGSLLVFALLVGVSALVAQSESAQTDYAGWRPRT